MLFGNRCLGNDGWEKCGSQQRSTLRLNDRWLIFPFRGRHGSAYCRKSSTSLGLLHVEFGTMPAKNQPCELQQLSANTLADTLVIVSKRIEAVRQAGDVQDARDMAKRAAALLAAAPDRIRQKIWEALVCIADVDCTSLPTVLPIILPSLISRSSTALKVSSLSREFDQRGRVPISGPLGKIIPSMENLRVVDMGLAATDRLLRILCLRCPHVEEIYARGGFISDDGIRMLGDTSNGTGACKQLKGLDIRNCRMLTAAAVARILLVLPKLEILLYGDGFAVFEKLLPEDWHGPISDDGNPEPHQQQLPLKFRLTHIEQSEPGLRPPTERLLTFLGFSCPDVDSLRLMVKDIETLLMLPRFPRLRSVALWLRVYAGSAFDQFFANVGSGLTQLLLSTHDLEDLPPESLVVIGMNCPNLEVFKYGWTMNSRFSFGERYYWPDAVFPENTGAFRNLRSLDYAALRHSMTEEEFLFMTAEAKNLGTLLVRTLDPVSVCFLSDDYWSKYLNEVNPLPELEVVSLAAIPETSAVLTVKTAELFLMKCPKLKAMIGPKAWKDDKSVKEFKDRMRKSNFELRIYC